MDSTADLGSNAATGHGPAATVDSVLARLGPRRTALVVAVDAPSGTCTAARGTMTAGGTAPDDRTLFEIGSVTKVFTAVLLMVMADAGEVDVDEPVQDLLPDGVRLPVVGRPVTLLDLATHRSGLPRLPLRWLLRLPGGAPGDDPYSGLTVDDVWHAVATVRRRRPGGASRYSNLGVGLLGHALEHRAGVPFADLLQQRVCGPLGLEDTTVGGRPEDAARTATGHDGKGRAVPHWRFGALAAAGGLHSTAADVLTFLRAQDAVDDTPVHRAIRATHVAVASRLAAQPCPGWMALHRRPGSPDRVLWHNGGTGGFRSWVGFVPGRDVRVVVLGAESRPVDRIGQDLVRALLTP